MRIVGRGRPRMRLDGAEAELLGRLFDELDEVLTEPPNHPVDDNDHIRARLFPAAYPDDPLASEDFRELTENTLRDERQERLDACRADLAPRGTPREVELADPDVTRRWLQVLNDLRLMHGIRLEVDEDDDPADLDPTDPANAPRLIYYWLSGVQDLLVRTVIG